MKQKHFYCARKVEAKIRFYYLKKKRKIIIVKNEGEKRIALRFF